MRVDLHNHTYLCKHAVGSMEEYIQKAIEQKIDIFGFSCHNPMEFDKQFRMDFAELPFYFQEIEKLKAKYASQITIKTALEIDFLPPYLEDRIFELPLDYRIGAVHFLGDWGFDNPEFIREYAKRDINVCWEQYFDAITQMAKTGKFDIVAHLDLLKIFNHRPTKDLRKKLEEKYTLCNYNILKKQESKDGTIKYLFDVLDGNAIETVLMRYHHGNSICVSSQIGCKMGCKFCASTGINFIRSLTSGEIVEQIIAVEQDTGEKISNVVFMGIGEPFDNYDNVVNAIKIINHPKGLNIGARHISISTSGLVPKIYQLAEENIQCTLSISLHATDNEKRSSMMPVNNVYPIEELMKACKDYIKKTNRRISFEYALAKDNNDNLEDAKQLVKLLKGMLCHVNLIPINKIENGKYDKSSNENIMKFRDYLNDHGIVATIRRELGSDIDAACGQLRRKELRD